MDRRRHKRIKRRIPCLVVVNGEPHQGIVLDLSIGNMFVQTNATMQCKGSVEVVFPATDQRPELRVRTRVARVKQVPPRLATVTRPGLGLEVVEAPPNYSRLIKGKPFLPQFRVQVRQSGSPRSRTLTLESIDEEEAKASALTITGGGWEVVGVEPA
jgi:hypothetical protein